MSLRSNPSTSLVSVMLAQTVAANLGRCAVEPVIDVGYVPYRFDGAGGGCPVVALSPRSVLRPGKLGANTEVCVGLIVHCSLDRCVQFPGVGATMRFRIYC